MLNIKCNDLRKAVAATLVTLSQPTEVEEAGAVASNGLSYIEIKIN